MSIIASLRFVMLLLAIFMVGGGFTLSKFTGWTRLRDFRSHVGTDVDVFDEAHDVVARNAAGRTFVFFHSSLSLHPLQSPAKSS
jgi:hypothetical protein